jgi:ParB-like chromosome segregation protein Spo0J
MAVGNLPAGTGRSDILSFPPSSFNKFSVGFTGRDPSSQDEAALLALAEEIAASPIGQIEPGIIVPDDDGGYVVRAGSRRLESLKRINRNFKEYQTRYPHLKEPLPFKAILLSAKRKLDEQQLVAICLHENFGRHDLTPQDRSYSARYLRDNLGWSHTKIAEKLHLSDSAVGKILAATDVAPEVQELVRDGAVSEAAARQIRKRPPHEQKKLADKIRKSPEPKREAKRQVRAAKERVRAEGGQAGRTIAEAREALVDISTRRAEDFLKWLGGNPNAPSLAVLMSDGPYRGGAVGS